MPCKPNYKKGDCLFHAVHGLCRVKKIVLKPELSKKNLCYCLEPKRNENVQTRFYVLVGHLREAGFYTPVSVIEAAEIIQHLKQGKPESMEKGNSRVETFFSSRDRPMAWKYANTILFYSSLGCKKLYNVDRKRFACAVEVLSRELALVLNLPIERVVNLIQNSLARYLTANSWQSGIINRILNS